MITKRDINNIESMLFLLAVTQHTNKRRASEALSTSVDTINKYIDNLEHDLNLKLLYSDSRGTNLTESGEKILESAKQIKDIVRGIYSANVENKKTLKEYSGQVRVAMNIGVNANLRPEAAKNFFDKYPNISIVSTVMSDKPKLDNMAYDITITDSRPTSPNVSVMREISVGCGFFASPEYIREHGQPLDFKDMLRNHRILTTANSAHYIKGWKDALKRANFVSFNTTSFESLVNLVNSGLGIAVLPLFYQKEGLVCLKNIPCESSLKFYLSAHNNIKDIPRVRTVIDFYAAMLDKIAEF